MNVDILIDTQQSMPTNLKPAPQPDYVLRGHAWEVQAIAFHPDGDLLYTGYTNA